MNTDDSDERAYESDDLKACSNNMTINESYANDAYARRSDDSLEILNIINNHGKNCSCLRQYSPNFQNGDFSQSVMLIRACRKYLKDNVDKKDKAQFIRSTLSGN
jgi:hypothetical protein